MNRFTVDCLSGLPAYLGGIRGVIFDLDDTLYPERMYVRSGFRAAAAAFPQIPELERRLTEVFERGGKAFDEVFSEEGFTEDDKAEAVRIYRFHDPVLELKEEIKNLLTELRKTKKTGIITDGRPEGQHAKIRALGLEQLVDDIIITDELGGPAFRKPCEKAFLLMQERWGFEAEEMAYIGDNPSKDFTAPEKLGMRSIYYCNPDGLYNESLRR